METKAHSQLPESDWSLKQIFRLVEITALPCVTLAAALLWSNDLSGPWAIVLGWIVIFGVARIVQILQKRYGRNTLWCESLSIFVVGFYVAIYLLSPNSDMVIFDAFAGIMGLLAGTGIRALRMAARKKRIIDGKLIRSRWQRKMEENFVCRIALLIIVAVAFLSAFILMGVVLLRYKAYRPSTFISAAILGFGIYGLAWTYRYEKRNGIRVIIER